MLKPRKLMSARNMILRSRGNKQKKRIKTNSLQMYLNEKTPWGLQRTIIPIFPSNLWRSFKVWLVLYLLSWGLGAKKKIGKARARTARRLLYYILLFHIHMKRLTKKWR